MKARLLTRLVSALLALMPGAWISGAQAADIKPIDLGKNVEVWFSEDHTVPIIAFNISLPAGSGYDPASKAGLASFAAALIDEGAGNMDSRAFHGALADHAIQFRAAADRDNLVISVVTLTENAPLAMHLVQMALIHPPMGIIVFLLHGIAPKISMSTIYRGVVPFLIADFGVLIILILLPGIVLWLPHALH